MLDKGLVNVCAVESPDGAGVRQSGQSKTKLQAYKLFTLEFPFIVLGCNALQVTNSAQRANRYGWL